MSTKCSISEAFSSWTSSGTGFPSPIRKHFEISDDSRNDLIESLKSRIEAQQRRIVSLELESKGSNAVTSELEKLQEKISALEAENIRLEARVLQLQLDNDMLRQTNESERLQKRIRHLEE